jgi:XTP/dITP diphosphohydrolase
MKFVTGNRYKFEEIARLLRREVTMASIPYPEIQTDTLEEVATFGLTHLAGSIDGSFFVEDSGLFIDALLGFPGVYSAYVSKTIGNEGILHLLADVHDRRAHFKSVIGYFDGEFHVFCGVCKGSIAETLRGTGGFGYDPIFIPNGDDRTFAEMATDEKNRYSHRGRAAQKFIEYLEG